MGKLPGGKKALKFNGHSIVLASFVIANKLGHKYKYNGIAVCDPRIGYVVTISHSKDYQVGQILNIENNVDYKSAKVVLCGPTNTGKTVLRDGLRKAIFKLQQASLDFLAISGCPD